MGSLESTLKFKVPAICPCCEVTTCCKLCDLIPGLCQLPGLPWALPPLTGHPKMGGGRRLPEAPVSYPADHPPSKPLSYCPLPCPNRLYLDLRFCGWPCLGREPLVRMFLGASRSDLDVSAARSPPLSRPASEWRRRGPRHLSPQLSYLPPLHQGRKA